MSFVVITLGSASLERLVVGSSTNTDFRGVHQIIDNIGNVLVFDLVRSCAGRIAVYVRSLEIDILIVGIDRDGLGAGKAQSETRAQMKSRYISGERHSRARSLKSE